MKNKFQRLLQDRKTLYLFLSIVAVSIFSLSVAYAALNTVLEIHGNSEIVASTWDIHLENAKLKDGSVVGASYGPNINGNNVSFVVDLSIPGDYFEFSVDVVNNGSIDAMIDSVVKTPELTADKV